MLHNSEQELVLQTHLEMIVAACLESGSKPVAILLYGGYGRGEGSWYIDESMGWRPYNDYDVRLIVTERLPTAVISDLERSLAEAIGIRWVDIGQFLPGELRKLKPTILNYDFKHGSRVIFGDSAILKTIPDFRPSELTTKDGLILYFTRLYALLGSFSARGLDSALEGEEARFFRNQMAKALLAVADVLLLTKGAYDASYRTRVDRAVQMLPKESELADLLQWAITEKLCPRADQLNENEARNLYRTVRDNYVREMYKVLSLHFGRSVSGPEDIEYCMKWQPVRAAKRLFWALSGRGPSTERKLAVMLAQSYIVAAWGHDVTGGSYLRRGVQLLRQVNSDLREGVTWDEARLEVARMRLEL